MDPQTPELTPPPCIQVMKLKYTLIQRIYILLILLSISSCAHKGAISGGPKDETPPVLKKSTPLLNQLNYTGKKIVLEFDENILLEEISKKFIVSPPMQQTPTPKAYGKKLYIDFDEELQENATYTFDFGDGVVDNNEKNPIENFAFAFSTGAYIDSLQVSGYLIYADNLDPASGFTIGVYKDLTDSAFQTKVPLRVARTNGEGYFNVKNMAPGEYRIYALKDANNNHRFDQKAEYIAFSTEHISPKIEIIDIPDTTWLDSLTIDTVIMVPTEVYTPFDLMLSTFREIDDRQSLSKKERVQQKRLDFYFRTAQEELPQIKLVNIPSEEPWYLLEQSAQNDSLYYWITDSNIYLCDTLKVELQYHKTDSNGLLAPITDTFNMNFRKPIQGNKRNRNKELPPEPELASLNLKTNKQGQAHIYSPVKIISETPFASFDVHAVSLLELIDSLTLPVDIKIHKTGTREYTIEANLEYGKNYSLELDSGACSDVFGLYNNTFNSIFSIRKEESYSEVSFTLDNIPATPMQVQLLSSQDKVVKENTCQQGVVSFDFIEPGTYYLRAYHDINKNEKWDTGNYAQKRQAETMYYYPKELILRVNGDISLTWDMGLLHPLEQKPEAIKNTLSREEK